MTTDFCCEFDSRSVLRAIIGRRCVDRDAARRCVRHADRPRQIPFTREARTGAKVLTVLSLTNVKREIGTILPGFGATRAEFALREGSQIIAGGRANADRNAGRVRRCDLRKFSDQESERGRSLFEQSSIILLLRIHVSLFIHTFARHIGAHKSAVSNKSILRDAYSYITDRGRVIEEMTFRSIYTFLCDAQARSAKWHLTYDYYSGQCRLSSSTLSSR